MISTWLSIKNWENSVSLSILNLLVLFQMMELPFNEWVIEWVYTCCDKWASPIGKQTEIFKILLSTRREEFQPVASIHELGDLFLSDVQLLEDFVLSEGNLREFQLLLLLGGLLDKSLLLLLLLGSWLLAVDVSRFNLLSKSVSSGLNWHTRAVETKREESINATLSLVSNLELTFWHWKTVS